MFLPFRYLFLATATWFLAYFLNMAMEEWLFNVKVLTLLRMYGLNNFQWSVLTTPMIVACALSWAFPTLTEYLPKLKTILAYMLFNIFIGFCLMVAYFHTSMSVDLFLVLRFVPANGVVIGSTIAYLARRRISAEMSI